MRKPPSWNVEVFVSYSPLPLQECTEPPYVASAFHVIIWITKERRKMDGALSFLGIMAKQELASQAVIHLLKLRLTKSSLILLPWVKWPFLVTFQQSN